LGQGFRSFTKDDQAKIGGWVVNGSDRFLLLRGEGDLMAIALSFSRWKDTACKFRFNAKYIAKTFVEPESEPMRVGSAVHTALELYLKHCYAEKRESDLAWFETYKFPADIAERCLEMVGKFRDMIGFQVPIDTPWYQIEAQAAFNDYLLHIPGEQGWFSKEAAFRTVADFVYIHGNAIFLIDWKTGRSEPDPFQIDLYRHFLPKLVPDMVLRQNRPERVVCIFAELAKGKMTTVGEFDIGADPTPMHNKITGKIAEVNTWTEFPATACDLCRFCRVPGCPVRDNSTTALVAHKESPAAQIPKEIYFVQDAEKALLFIQFAETVVDQVKDLLRTWVEKNGTVTAGGKRAELRENNPWKAGDVERILKTLIAYGVPKSDALGALTLSESALEKILKKFKMPGKLPMMLALGERKTYKPKFGIYNAKEDDY
jgi:hypothetical protein